MRFVTKYGAVNLLPELKVDAGRWSRIHEEQFIAAAAKGVETIAIKLLRVQDNHQVLITSKK